MGKRLFDLIGAAIGLVLLAPLLGVLAVVVKLDSVGPVFFRQQRVGLNGKLFAIHKLRTMVDGAAGPPITVGDDVRVTRSGRWLRRMRLDELPQLIDVLAGDMSLVGPRPEVPRYVALYPPGLRERALSIRPGLTDPASLAFINESDILARAQDPEQAYVELVLPLKLKAAVEYAETATLWSDVLVLVRTVRTLVRQA